MKATVVYYIIGLLLIIWNVVALLRSNYLLLDPMINRGVNFSEKVLNVLLSFALAIVGLLFIWIGRQAAKKSKMISAKSLLESLPE